MEGSGHDRRAAGGADDRLALNKPPRISLIDTAEENLRL